MSFSKSTIELLDKNGYNFIKKLGSGYQGSVIKVFDLDWQKEAALKLVRTTPDNLEPHLRLEQEFQVLKASDPEVGLLQVYKYGRDDCDGQVLSWFTMELCEASLKDVIAKRPLDVRVVCAWECLRGLAYLHQKGVSHRDIKPSNLLLDSNNRIKIGDFGTVKVVRRPSERRGADQLYLVGTPPYISPELWSALDRDEVPDNRVWLASDQYAAGVTCYQILSGGMLPPKLQAVLSENSEQSERTVRNLVAMTHQAGIFEPLSLPNHSGPLNINAVLRKMMETDWRRRYPSVAECVLAFVHALFYDGLIAAPRKVVA